MEELTTPSQRRYIQYFSMLLDCIQPRKEAFLLKSLKLTDMPLEGASPEIQVDVFNCGLLIFATRVTVPPESSTINIVCGRLIRVGKSGLWRIGQHYHSLQTDPRRWEEDQRVPLHVPHGLQQHVAPALHEGAVGWSVQHWKVSGWKG